MDIDFKCGDEIRNAHDLHVIMYLILILRKGEKVMDISFKRASQLQNALINVVLHYVLDIYKRETVTQTLAFSVLINFEMHSLWASLFQCT